MALIQCPQCGNSVSELAVACPKCGHKMNSSAPTNPSPKKPKAAKGHRYVLWIVLACLLAVGGAVFFIFDLGHSGEECYERGMKYILFKLPEDVFYSSLEDHEGEPGHHEFFDNLHRITNNREASRWFHRGSKKGHAGCLLMEGCMYYFGYNGEKNMYKATELFYKASEKGSDMATTLYALQAMIECSNKGIFEMYYPNNLENAEKMEKGVMATDMLKEAYNNDCPEAIYLVGYFNFLNGEYTSAETNVNKAKALGVRDCMRIRQQIMMIEEWGMDPGQQFSYGY